MVNRTQGLVLGFFVVVWVSLLVIVVVAPEVDDQALRLPGGRGAELAVLAVLSGFIGLLAVGVVRRWHWTFWLVLVAFLSACSGCRWPRCSSPGSWPPTHQSGMCCIRGCSASS